MTRKAWIGVLFVGALSGCMPTNFIAPTDKTAAKPVEPERTVIRPPVTAGQINGTNAKDKADALRNEMDRDMERAIEANDAKPEKK